MKNSINFAKLFVLAMLMMFVVACAKKETATTPAEGEVTSEAVVSTATPADIVVEETPVASTSEAPAAE